MATRGGFTECDGGGIIKIAPDGSILNARELRGTWSLSGSTLLLRWPNKQAPSGAWLDRVVLSPDRKRYDGRNQRGLVVHGVRVGELRASHIADPRSERRRYRVACHPIVDPMG